MQSPPRVESAPPQPVPAGAERVFFTPSSFLVDGEYPELSADREALLGARAGTYLSAADVFRLASALEAAYARRGYVLARVVVPNQTLSNGGEVRLVVVDGFVERVDASALPERVRGRVEAVLRALEGRSRPTLAEIERALLMAGDTPGLALRSTLVAGARPGGSVLIVDGEHRVASGQLLTDNRLADSLGRAQFGTVLSLNSALGLGEQVYAQARTGAPLSAQGGNDPRWRVLVLGGDMPVGSDGWRIGAEFADARTHATPPPGGLDVAGLMRRGSITLSHLLRRDQDGASTVSIAIEQLDQRSRAIAFETDVSHDRYAALRARFDWLGVTPWEAPANAQLTLSRGLGGRDAATAAEDRVPLSRQGAGPSFTKADAQVRLAQPLGAGGARLAVTLAAQTSFGRPMLVPEQFLLDGPNLLSGVASGSLAVDRGISGRAELQHDQPFAGGPGYAGVLRPYAFAAYGTGWLAQPTALEQPRVSGRSLGFGARLDVGAGRGVYAGLEWAYSWIDSPLLSDGSRITATLTVPF
jgi:hemolysin activation/secretion protein